MSDRFYPTRLITARQRRRMLKGELADAAGISSRSITFYEKGEREPSADVLSALAKALNCGVELFAMAPSETVNENKVSFRATTEMSARDKAEAISIASFASDVVRVVEADFELPPLALPDMRGIEPETAAEVLRNEWGLGEDPLPNVVHLLEAHGVRVFSLKRRTNALDAYATWVDGTPFTLLADGKSPEHGRFDGAHELFHLLAHREEKPQGREAEREAHGFASAFLLPAQAVERQFFAARRGFVLDDVLKLKAPWRVSAAAYVKRLHSLKLISDEQYRDLFITMSARGWRKAEPAPRLQRSERSSILESAFREILRQKGAARVCKELGGIQPNDLSDLVFGIVPAVLEGEGQKDPEAARAAPALHLVK